MPSTQTEIYFLAAESLETARQSPLLEAFRQRNLDVLFLVDPVDEWVTPALDVYDGCKLRAIDRGDLELGDETQRAEERRQREEAEPAFRPLLDFLRAKLTDEVSDVRLSGRLTESACCLVSDGQGPGANLERILRAMGQEAPKQRRILEVNPRHALLTRLKGLFETDRDSAQLAEFVGLLFDQALVAEGAAPRNPRQFTQALARLMAGNG
jgi:molecular chaperone HtpG